MTVFKRSIDKKFVFNGKDLLPNLIVCIQITSAYRHAVQIGCNSFK